MRASLENAIGRFHGELQRIIVLAAVLTMNPACADAHDAKAFADAAQGDMRRWQWFDELKQPASGEPCCNMTDCYRTEARQLLDGSWKAILTDYKGKRWVQIPLEKVVKHPLSIDGEAYICNSLGMGYEETTIFCFIPPIPGY
jgi:hypothetical protein